jgi:poly(A) polymerase
MPFRRMLYEYGADLSHEAALLFAATENKSADLEPALRQAAEWQKPAFPLQGGDLLGLGLKPGPKMGEILRTVENWWIDRDFRPSKEECVAEAKRQLAISSPP